MKKILVADDEMSIRLLYSEELKEEGYDVYLASNGREALAKIRLGMLLQAAPMFPAPSTPSPTR